MFSFLLVIILALALATASPAPPTRGQQVGRPSSIRAGPAGSGHLAGLTNGIFDDQPEEQDPAEPAGLYRTAAEANSSLTSLAPERLVQRNSSQPPAQENLGGSFLSLFDQMLKFNTFGREILGRLNYFGPPRRNGTQRAKTAANSTFRPEVRPANLSLPVGGEANQASSQPAAPSGLAEPAAETDDDDSDEAPSKPTPSAGSSYNHVKKQEFSLLTDMALGMRSWLLALQEKLNKLLTRLSPPAGKLSLTAKLNCPQQQASPAVNNPNSVVLTGEAEGATDDDHPDGFKPPRMPQIGEPRPKSAGYKPLSKRDTSPSELAGLGAPTGNPIDEALLGISSSPLMERSERCLTPNANLASQCRAVEMVLDANLSNSIPGSMANIEENCNQALFLLSNCWPEQLEELRAMLRTWNESAVSHSDFPLPDRPATRNGRPLCQLSPMVSATTMDRFNWMWLNLCTDRKFRRDYVDNIRCLSLWTPERSNQVCSNDYRRLQAKLAIPSQPADSQTDPKRVPETSDGYYLQQVAGNKPEMTPTNKMLEFMERELESKVLCCTFDVFLRCVYRQAAKDCGRSGGQFVVNFMARIGNDDMKFLCNNEPRMSSLPTPEAGPYRESAQALQPVSQLPGSRGPFVELGYCQDFRIFSALYGSHNMVNSRNPSPARPLGPPTGGGQGAGAPSGNGNADSSYPGSSYDIAFYAGQSDSYGSNKASRRLSTLSTLAMFLPWLLAFSFNTLLLDMIASFSAG